MTEADYTTIDPIIARDVSLKMLKEEGYSLLSNGFGQWLEKCNADDEPHRIFFPAWVNELMVMSRKEGAKEVQDELRCLLRKR